MKQRRIRINLEDTEGAKFKFDIEGNVTKDKVLKLFELMDLMNIEEEQTPDLDSEGGKIWNVVETTSLQASSPLQACLKSMRMSITNLSN